MNYCSILISLLTVLLLSSCNNDKPRSIVIIPKPNNVVQKIANDFVMGNQTMIILSDPLDEELIDIAQHLLDFINLKYSFNLEISFSPSSSNSAEGSRGIFISKHDGSEFNEQYELNIEEEKIEIHASSYSGVFYAIQSLKQLMFESNKLPILTISDKPQYAYRGLMLDVSRHFFAVEEVKRTIDLMAQYKFNTLHWHLTDDQGWRIEIEEYPLLTSIGSYRTESQVEKNFNPYIGDGIEYGGFYTQDEIRDVVLYAKERYITIIPEIDMPGHMQAALAAYPELACTSGPFNVSTRWGVHNDILCPSELTFKFAEDVLLEVMALFPSQYIHIGGDEVPTTKWKVSEVAQQVIQEQGLASEHELQGYFYQRISDFLKQHNRKAIGWDEIQEKGITDKTTVMAWRGLEHAEASIENGHQVILNPASFTYLNYYQGDRDKEPLAQCCLVTLEQVYKFNLNFEQFTEFENELVLGGQGSLWSEYISSQSHLEYMMMPRMMALSEALWSDSETKNFEQFKSKLSYHFSYLDSLGVNYRPLSD